MPMNQKVPWLLCYDIKHPRRLNKIYRVVCQYAMPLQYSVFLTYATRRRMTMIVAHLETLIDPRSDDLRAYPLSTRVQPFVYGKPIIPKGVSMFESQPINVLSRFMVAQEHLENR